MAKDLLENLPVPVFVLDDDFRIIRYNGLFESLVGKAPLERFLYEVFRDHKSSMHYNLQERRYCVNAFLPNTISRKKILLHDP